MQFSPSNRSTKNVYAHMVIVAYCSDMIIRAFSASVLRLRGHVSVEFTTVITSVTLNAERELEKLFNHNVPRVVVYLEILYYVVCRNLKIVVNSSPSDCSRSRNSSSTYQPMMLQN